ncbi:MAG: DUF1932 domain-containing protein [Gammaproteobacteria bacterium]|nr:DUF1932 domain-containing protein [Gammaproteobacteria bacterium]
MTTVGVINPGAMGASVAAAVAGNGHRVVWAGDGRSRATHDRASQAGIKDCGSIKALAAESDIIISVCPPANAADVAVDVVSAGFRGLLVDANAISPARARGIATNVTSGGAGFVDGGIIGGPAWTRDSRTVLHLSGDEASTIAGLFVDSPLHTNIVSAEVGAASALKMVFAAYTKGSTALLTAILGVAEKEGVRGDLEKQWGEEFTDQTHRRVTANTAKAWRFVGEMEEIAATFAGAGLSHGFHSAAADTFSRLEPFKDNPAQAIETVLEALLANQSEDK